MPVRSHLLVVIFAFLLGGAVFTPASAQDNKGWLGVDVRDLTRAEADRLGWDGPRGAIVTAAPERGSPAERAGLVAGDIIIAIERTLIDTAAEFIAAVEAKAPGSELRLQVLSNGRERRVAATVTSQPRSQVAGTELPQLILDTGGHLGLVNGLVFTPDGKQIVSASDDKVIRVWDWQAGKTVRFIRGQVGPASEGSIFAIGLSPNGRWLAAGGYLGNFKGSGPREDEEAHKVRLYDFATGRLVALMKGHAGVVFGLAFSPDGSRLLTGSGLGDKSAILWDVENRKVAHRLVGHEAEVYGVAFSPDGQRAITGSNDMLLRLWNVRDGKLITQMPGHKAKLWGALTVRASDGMIASGDAEGEIRLWDGRTGAFIKTLTKQRNSVGNLMFSKDGKLLMASTGYQTTGSDFFIRVYEVATGKETVTYTKHDSIVVASTIGPDGTFGTIGGQRFQMELWDPRNGETKKEIAGSGKATWAVGFSPDNRRIGWGGTIREGQINYRGPMEMQLQLPNAKQNVGRPEPVNETVSKTFVRANAALAGITLERRKGGNYNFDAILDIKKDGKTLASIERDSSSGYDHRSYSVAVDGHSIISGGGNGALAAYDLQGKKICSFIGHEGDVWALTPSPDGRLLVSGGNDLTVRLWNIKTCELIVTLFSGSDGEWVMWTPQGYYTGSPGSDKIVGWQINKGPANAADYVGAEQLRSHLNRPDVVEKAIILASAEQAIRDSRGTAFKLADLLAKPVPKFRIVSPASGSIERRGRASIKIALEAVRDPIKSMRVQVNGRMVSEITPELGEGGFKAGEHDLDVPLGRGRNDVRITLNNSTGDTTETVTVNHEGEGLLDKRGTLFILAVGVDRYPGLGKTCGEYGTASCDLRFSGADARRLVEAAEARLGPSHTNVVKRLLVNGAGPNDAPTARNIIDAIDMLKQATEIDTVLLFIAGHGANDGASYRFLATDAERSGSAFRGVTVVSWQLLQEAIESAKGRRVLFLDTCHSGSASNQTLGNAAYHANIITYASAQFDQEALEDADLGHGLFTYAVVEGLEGKGKAGAKREISTKELAEYVVTRVDQMAQKFKAAQKPQYFKGRDADDYVLARW